MITHTKNQGSRPCSFRKEDFFIDFLYISVCKISDPLYRPKRLGRGPLDDATHQISRLQALWFQTQRFLMVYFENIFLACVTYMHDRNPAITIAHHEPMAHVS